jgi:hypothetical protein
VGRGGHFTALLVSALYVCQQALLFSSHHSVCSCLFIRGKLWGGMAIVLLFW